MSLDSISSNEPGSPNMSFTGSPQASKKGLGMVVFKPRGTAQVYKAEIRTDQSLARTDSAVKYNTVTEFVEAAEVEIGSPNGNGFSLRKVASARGGRSLYSARTGNSDEDMVYAFDRDPLTGVKMDHSNVWL